MFDSISNTKADIDGNSIDDDASASEPTNNTDIDVAPHKRQRRLRKDVFAGLPTERIEIDLPDSEKVCDFCEGKLHRMGENSHREIEYVFAILTVKEIVHIKYGYRQYETDVKRVVIIPRLIPMIYASVSLLVHLIISKYSDHLPLFRIEKQFKRLAFILPRPTQSEWLINIVEKLKPLITLMADNIRDGPTLWTDDTILPLTNDDPNRDRTIQVRLWSYVGGPLDEPITMVYEFTRTRKLDGPASWLKDYSGYVHADAYPGYDHLFKSGDI